MAETKSKLYKGHAWYGQFGANENGVTYKKNNAESSSEKNYRQFVKELRKKKNKNTGDEKDC